MLVLIIILFFTTTAAKPLSQCSYAWQSPQRVTGSFLDFPEIKDAITQSHLEKNISTIDLFYSDTLGFMTNDVLNKINNKVTTNSITVGNVQNLDSVYMIVRYIDRDWNKKMGQPWSQRSYISMYPIVLEHVASFLITQTTNFVADVPVCTFDDILTSHIQDAIDYAVKLIGNKLENKTVC